MIDPTSIFSDIQPVGYWAYIIVAVSVIFEGPIATLAASVAASAGYLNPGAVFVSAAAGNTIGDILWYLLGRTTSLKRIDRYLRWLRFRPEQIEQLEGDINDKAGYMIFIAKLTLGFIVPTLIATGLARVPWRRWFGALFLAECLWTAGLVTAGYYLGAYILNLESGLRYLAAGAAIACVILAGLYLKRLHDREINNHNQA